MKKITKYFAIGILALIFTSCKTNEKTAEILTINLSETNNKSGKMAFEFTKGKAHNHPTFVIWAEDPEGNYLKTIFITKSYAGGIFGHKMVGDSMWLPIKGQSNQPAALPYWTHKKGLINGKDLIPSPENPYTDAVTGATPSSNFKLDAKSLTPPYRILFEVNQAWDWNNYWTNNKFPDNDAYKHSAQPSIIYGVSINDTDSVYYMNPIGHGDPKGETGRLFTDLSTLTTAKNIYSTIKITKQ